MHSTCQFLDLKSNQVLCFIGEMKTFMLPLQYSEAIHLCFFIALKDGAVKELMVIRTDETQSDFCHQLFLTKEELQDLAANVDTKTRRSVNDLLRDLVNRQIEYDALRDKLPSARKDSQLLYDSSESIRDLFVGLGDAIEINWEHFHRPVDGLVNDERFQDSHFRPTTERGNLGEATLIVTWDHDDFDPSTTLSSVAIARRCIPRSIRVKIFDPSTQDLVGEYLDDISECHTTFDRVLVNSRYALQMSVIVLECLRIWATQSAMKVLGKAGASAVLAYVLGWLASKWK